VRVTSRPSATLELANDPAIKLPVITASLRAP
jgi:hypothetical protein